MLTHGNSFTSYGSGGYSSRSSLGNYGGGLGYENTNYVASGYGRPRYSSYSNKYDATSYPTPVNYRITSRPPTPTKPITYSRAQSVRRDVPSLQPDASVLGARAARHRTVFRAGSSWRDPSPAPSTQNPNRNLRLKSPSLPKETTRDQLIDSIVHTRTKEHRVMPGFKASTDYDERRALRVDCDKVYNGIILANGDTIQDINYLKSVGVTHVLNTAERHVAVNPAKFGCYGIHYYGFHVDDLPQANISRHFHRTSEFIHNAVKSGGLVVVNCVMGWSRSASVVAAYLMMKHNYEASKALELIRQTRPIRPNAGFLQQLADLENTLTKRIW